MRAVVSNVRLLSLLSALLVPATLFGRDFAMPSIPVPMGPSTDQVRAEREEAAMLRNREGKAGRGESKSLLCEGCHGEDGNSSDPMIPKLAGQYRNYIIKQVRNYQLGSRSHGIMSAMAATIGDNDLLDAAAYFASRKQMEGTGQEGSPAGKELFFNEGISDMGLACANCHGENGRGLKPGISAFPLIGGQHKEYIRQQLFDFREGNRTNSPNSIMNRMTESLTDDQIEALAEFLSGQ